jgi:hypothetical protein
MIAVVVRPLPGTALVQCALANESRETLRAAAQELLRRADAEEQELEAMPRPRLPYADD